MDISSHLTSALRTGRLTRRASAFGLVAGLALPLVAAANGANAVTAPAATTVVSEVFQQLSLTSQTPAGSNSGGVTVNAAVSQANLAQAELAAALAAAEAARAAEELAARTWHVPVATYYISSPFGEMRYSGPHIGLDFAGNDGKPVVAARHGVVTQAGWEDGYGFAVAVDHGDGHSTKYAHLAEQPLVAVGQQVVGGQQLGNVGNTGDSTGPHLHFELLSYGQRIDPASVIAIPPSQGLTAP